MKFITDTEEQKRLLDSPDYYIGEYHETIPAELTFDVDKVSVTLDSGIEVTDKLPHIRDLDRCQVSLLKSLKNTIITGELLIPRVPIDDMEYILNHRDSVSMQEKRGKFYVRANDIRYFRGIKLERMPFHRRRKYLHRVTEQLQSSYIREKEMHKDGVPSTEEMYSYITKRTSIIEHDYPVMADDFYYNCDTEYDDNYENDGYDYGEDRRAFTLSYRGYYEYLCLRGNRQGVILRHKDGKYGDECFVIECGLKNNLKTY